jgi:hypothetical protein
MKIRIPSLIAIALLASALQAQSPQGSPGSVPPTGPRAAEIERIIEAHYIRQFTTEIQPSDEQWNKLLPLIQTFIQKRFQNAAQKQRAQTALEHAPESEQRQLIETIDKASAQTANIDRTFRNSVDPILSLKQQAKLRQLDSNIWPRLQDMINQAREQAQERQQLQQEEQRRRQERQALRGNKNQPPNQPKRAVR